VRGGPFTRRDPATGGQSCLDLFVVSRELRPYVSSLVIDSGREMAVARAVRERGVAKLVYSDHYAGLLKFEGLPRRRREVKEKVEAKWNIAKPGGWNRYKVLTEEHSEQLERIVEGGNSIQEKMDKFEKVHNNIKFKAFGKVHIKKRETENTHNDSNVQRDVKANELLEEQTKRAEKELEEIKTIGKCKVGKVWEAKKKIVNGKKAPIEATAIVHPKTGKLVVEREEIKNVTLKYCKDTLKSNEPEEGYEDEIRKKRYEVNKRLSETDGSFVIKKVTFDKVIEKFKKSNKRNYDFLIRSSESFQGVVFKLCQIMAAEETFPESFRNTTLHMIFKGGKGRREVLSDNRFIHSKPWLPRAAEACVVEEGLKGPLVEGSSMYQIGGQPGHRAEELIFVMKSIIAHQRAKGKALIIQCWDLSKYFDKEMIEDAILTCYKRKVNPKAARIWYKLNQNTRIQVKTGVGMSDFTEVGAVVGQGTIGGALVSQAVLDEAISEEFCPGEEHEANYGQVPMQPCMFQDDLIHAALGTKEAREAGDKIHKAIKKRGLNLNETKSVYIIVGTKKQKETLREEFESNPLMCGATKMIQKEKDKWLGQQLASGGLADSVAATVAAREGKIRGAGLEIANIVNDWRSQAAGGMETALLLWEACCIPSLLHGAGTWVDITRATERKLNMLQQWFLRLVLQVGPGAPLASLCWETGTVDMKLRIWKEKLMLVLHLRGLGERTLAGSVYKEQVARGWPGLAKEAKEICVKLKIEDCNSANITTTLDKSHYKRIIKEAIIKKNESILRGEAEGKTKCIKIMKDKYGKKTYMSESLIGEVRKWYRTRVGMLPFAGNYTHDKRFARTDWMCRCETSKENEPHLRSGECPIYNDLIEKYTNLDDDKELLNYFQEVIKRRDMIDDINEEEKREEEERAAEIPPLMPASWASTQ
jgi:hypothetical protein